MAALSSGKNSYQGIIDWISSTATNGNAGVSKHADTATSATNATNATNATTATKLGTNAGSANNPVYFSGGKPVACNATMTTNITGSATKLGSTTVGGDASNKGIPIFLNAGAATACDKIKGIPVYLPIDPAAANQVNGMIWIES